VGNSGDNDVDDDDPSLLSLLYLLGRGTFRTESQSDRTAAVSSDSVKLD